MRLTSKSGRTEATLGQFVGSRGRTVNPARSPTKLFELYSIPSFPTRVPEFVTGNQIGSSKQEVESGTVLLSKINPRINRAWVVANHTTNPKIASTEWITFPPDERVLPEFLSYYLQQDWIRDFLASNASGVGGSLMRVKGTTLRELPFAYPDRREQATIVSWLDEEFSRLDKSTSSLGKAAKLLSRYRNSVLKAACEGNLTGTTPPGRQTGNSIKNADAVHLPDLPIGWNWVRLADLGENPDEPIQTGPFGAQLHASEFQDSGVPVIAVGNLTGMGFTKNKLYYINATKAKQLARYDVQAGDLLFARSGATLGKVCVAPPFVADWRMTGHILRARLDTSRIDPQFAVYALGAYEPVRSQVFGQVRGVTRPGFNTKLLKNVFIPVPPRKEQVLIIAEVERRLSIVGHLEAAIEEGATRSSRLRQSILQQVFGRGHAQCQ